MKALDDALERNLHKTIDEKKWVVRKVLEIGAKTMVGSVRNAASSIWSNETYRWHIQNILYGIGVFLFIVMCAFLSTIIPNIMSWLGIFTVGVVCFYVVGMLINMFIEIWSS